MEHRDIRIRSTSGTRGEFDCYVVTPDGQGKVPAIVLASAIHGVDPDLRAIAEEFGNAGYIAAAPDLFWRTVPGALARGDARCAPRGQPRHEKIRQGEADLADTLTDLSKHARFNGRAAVMGFCYGGPYAILGPSYLGYDAGIACHGTQLGDYVKALEGVTQPLCIIWGDQDHAAPPEVQATFRQLSDRKQNVEVYIFPGVQHGYMMPGAGAAFDKATRAFSMERALAILKGLRDEARAPQSA